MMVVVDLINESNNMSQLSPGFAWSMSHDRMTLQNTGYFCKYANVNAAKDTGF